MDRPWTPCLARASRLGVLAASNSVGPPGSTGNPPRPSATSITILLSFFSFNSRTAIEYPFFGSFSDFWQKTTSRSGLLLFLRNYFTLAAESGCPASFYYFCWEIEFPISTKKSTGRQDHEHKLYPTDYLRLFGPDRSEQEPQFAQQTGLLGRGFEMPGSATGSRAPRNALEPRSLRERRTDPGGKTAAGRRILRPCPSDFWARTGKCSTRSLPPPTDWPRKSIG